MSRNDLFDSKPSMYPDGHGLRNLERGIALLVHRFRTLDQDHASLMAKQIADEIGFVPPNFSEFNGAEVSLERVRTLGIGMGERQNGRLLLCGFH
jgi:hypothetical protein